MPRISAERKQDRYQSLLQAARRVLAEKGYAGTSIAEIAQEAGVSDGLLYRYFDNKRDMVEQVLRDFYGRLLARMEDEVSRRRGIADQLRALIEAHLLAFVEEADLCRLFIAEVRVAAEYPGSEMQKLNRRYTSVLLRVVERGVEEGVVRPGLDLRLFRDLLFGGLEHLAWRHVNGGRELDVKGDAEVIAGILLNGVKA